jgi:hypothetical protein
MEFNYPESCYTDQHKKEFLENLIKNKGFENEEERIAIGAALAEIIHTGDFSR